MNGSDAERRLCRILVDAGWHAHRAGASGSGTTADLPDLAAAKHGTGIAVELKTRADDTVYLDREEIAALDRYAVAFGLRPAVGVRWGGERAFYLYDPRRLYQTDGGRYRVQRSDGAGFVFCDPDGSAETGLEPDAVDGPAVVNTLGTHAALSDDAADADLDLGEPGEGTNDE